jgi:hypothetical protein
MAIGSLIKEISEKSISATDSILWIISVILCWGSDCVNHVSEEVRNSLGGQILLIGLVWTSTCMSW